MGVLLLAIVAVAVQHIASGTIFDFLEIVLGEFAEVETKLTGGPGEVPKHVAAFRLQSFTTCLGNVSVAVAPYLRNLLTQFTGLTNQLQSQVFETGNRAGVGIERGATRVFLIRIKGQPRVD
jgi:hypothetical protein